MSGPAEWRIRRAIPDDAPALAELANRTFRDAFAGTNDPAHIDDYCAEAFSTAALSREIGDTDTIILLVESGDALIAYAQLHFGSAPACVTGTSPALLKRIYVEQAWHGTGLAWRLLDRVAQLMKDQGASTLWLTVWERNPRAIRFYERSGMSVVGEAEFILGSEVQRDLVMAAPLTLLRP